MQKIVRCLLLLCLFDAVATDIGIRTGFIEEGNPLMGMIYEQSKIVFYCCKLIFPVLLVILYEKHIQSKLLTVLVGVCFTLYVAVTMIHASWIGVVFITLK
ncbi:DUF5658 family protein [Bacillus sp. 1P06AnD]|uniref:DUF5658 family protein n=1 Tax=Bacillus sp. 1P06AnD TaxID=3132208 RepID=UPI0039A00ED3